MSLSNSLGEHVRACFTGLYVRSHEPDEALAEIRKLCQAENWQVLAWDAVGGVNGDGNADPLSTIAALRGFSEPESSLLLVLQGFHHFLGSPEIQQAVFSAIMDGKRNRAFVVVLSPVVRIPVELQKHFVVLEHALPSRDELETIARGIGTQEGDLPPDIGPLLDASAGLTRYEAEGAYSLSLVRHGHIEPRPVWEHKAQMLKASGAIELYSGSERFSDLGGLDSLKLFCHRSLKSKSNAARPRGVLLLGVPGSGKSAFAKALGNETGRPTLALDLGGLMGSLVGQTEESLRRALATIDAMAPCVVFVDEIEKGLSGAGASNDGGVATRMFGTLLTWLNDHTSDVYFVATSNDVSRLPPEFARAERFDAIFFVDLRGETERSVIWDLYRQKFSLDGDEAPADNGWTGAEIKACCRLAAMFGCSLPEAALNVVPVSRTAADKIAALREWADGRCLDANLPGVFQRQDVASASPARNLIRPSRN
jgi:hypothetical protein